jgi:hypothetical protein
MLGDGIEAGWRVSPRTPNVVVIVLRRADEE